MEGVTVPFFNFLKKSWPYARKDKLFLFFAYLGSFSLLILFCGGAAYREIYGSITGHTFFNLKLEDSLLQVWKIAVHQNAFWQIIATFGLINFLEEFVPWLIRRAPAIKRGKFFASMLSTLEKVPNLAGMAILFSIIGFNRGGVYFGIVVIFTWGANNLLRALNHVFSQVELGNALLRLSMTIVFWFLIYESLSSLFRGDQNFVREARESICNDFRMVSVTTHTSENHTGWLFGEGNGRIFIREKGSADIYQTVALERNFVSAVNDFSELSFTKEKGVAFKLCELE